MKIYNTSKDYELLWQIIQTGAEVIVYVKRPFDDTPRLDILKYHPLGSFDKEQAFKEWKSRELEFVIPRIEIGPQGQRVLWGQIGLGPVWYNLDYFKNNEKQGWRRAGPFTETPNQASASVFHEESGPFPKKRLIDLSMQEIAEMDVTGKKPKTIETESGIEFNGDSIQELATEVFAIFGGNNKPSVNVIVPRDNYKKLVDDMIESDLWLVGPGDEFFHIPTCVSISMPLQKLKS